MGNLCVRFKQTNQIHRCPLVSHPCLAVMDCDIQNSWPSLSDAQRNMSAEKTISKEKCKNRFASANVPNQSSFLHLVFSFFRFFFALSPYFFFFYLSRKLIDLELTTTAQLAEDAEIGKTEQHDFIVET